MNDTVAICTFFPGMVFVCTGAAYSAARFVVTSEFAAQAFAVWFGCGLVGLMLLLWWRSMQTLPKREE